MNQQYITDLTNYILWADAITMEWLSQITDDQWNQQITSSFSSIKQTALHIASAQRVWLDFWKHTPNPVFLSVEFNGTKEDLIKIWKQSSRDLKKLIENYTEENYTQLITFQWPRGGTSSMQFWQTLNHMINHSTYHRGQLVTLLRQAGFTTLSSTDLATYYRLNLSGKSLASEQ